ncbi:MAG: cytochrome c1 [Epsilonproteobacteria bacterium]|nr:cytochrome c1 [Campylobacterota bacterium]
MKELKIFGIVAAFTLILYWGVEPFAHSQMHKHVEGHNLVYDGKADIEEASKDKKEAKKKFWAEVKEIAKLKGDPVAGEATYAMCAGCHMEGAANMGGVTPPSLDHAGAIYDKNFLIALIKNPAMATNVDHKYKDTSTHPMGSISSMVSAPQDIANVVAYLKAKKAGEVTPKEAYIEACGRCHANRYGKLTQLGEIPKTKSNIKTGQDIEKMKYDQKVAEEQAALADYLGKLPPDLSIIYRARSEHFLHTFVENPQSQLAGTAMPRTGLDHEGMEKVMAYLEETGDPSKPARDALGPYVLIFFVIFTILAYLWKKSQWKDLH